MSRRNKIITATRKLVLLNPRGIADYSVALADLVELVINVTVRCIMGVGRGTVLLFIERIQLHQRGSTHESQRSDA